MVIYEQLPFIFFGFQLPCISSFCKKLPKMHLRRKKVSFPALTYHFLHNPNNRQKRLIEPTLITLICLSLSR
ncbi:hypothetical protein KSS87_017257, partial [Heliosperma pusillum]